MGVICISTICFVLSTLPELQEEEFEGKFFFFRENEIYLKLFIIFLFPEEEIDISSDDSNSTKPIVDLSGLFEGPFIDYDLIRFSLKVIDWITVAYFLLEYILRFVCSPDKRKFFFKVKIFQLGLEKVCRLHSFKK